MCWSVFCWILEGDLLEICSILCHAAISSLVFCSSTSSQLGIPILSAASQLRESTGFNLPDMAWKPSQSSKLGRIAGLISFVSHFSGITVFNCLMSSILKTIVLYHLSWVFFVCFSGGVGDKKSGPCDSILARSGSPSHWDFEVNLLPKHKLIYPN